MATRQLITREKDLRPGCSECEWSFITDGFAMPRGANRVASAIQLEFNAHDCTAFRPAKKNPREDVNQAAARIIREATERD